MTTAEGLKDKETLVENKFTGQVFIFDGDGAERALPAFVQNRDINPKGEYNQAGMFILDEQDRVDILSPQDPTKIIWSGNVSHLNVQDEAIRPYFSKGLKAIIHTQKPDPVLVAAS